MILRYDLRHDAGGWTVFDIWTGQPVAEGEAAYVSLPLKDAIARAERLNSHAWRCGSPVLQ
jgi:hypothetical protein